MATNKSLIKTEFIIGGNVLKRLFVNYVRPLWKPIIIGLALSLVSTLLMVSQPLVMKNLINTLTGGQTTSFIRNVTLLISIPIFKHISYLVLAKKFHKNSVKIHFKVC